MFNGIYYIINNSLNKAFVINGRSVTNVKKGILLVTIMIAAVLLFDQGMTLFTNKSKVIHDDVIGTVHQLETPAQHKSGIIHYLSTSPVVGNETKTKALSYLDFMD